MTSEHPHVPAIAALVLNYRDAARTSRCVASLLSAGVMHVCVWDNSADEGASAAALRDMVAEDDRLSLHVSGHNLGFAAGVNRGLAWLRGRYPEAWVLLLNNDAYLLPGALPALRAALLQQPHAVVAYPAIRQGGRVQGPLYYQRHSGLITHRPLPGSIPYATGCCLLLATDRWTGPWFDETFFMYGEDVELSWRLGPQRLVHVPHARVVHEGSASSGMATPFYETQLVSSHWRLVDKLARTRVEAMLMRLGRACALPLRAGLRAWRYRSLVPLKALLWGYQHARRPAPARPAVRPEPATRSPPRYRDRDDPS